MKKHLYWILRYCQFECSECGFISEDSYPLKDYCPSCHADMREPLKRCYYLENNPGQTYCPCGESHYCYDDGLLYCKYYTSLVKQKLKGYWYPCGDSRLKTPETVQLSFFDDV